MQSVYSTASAWWGLSSWLTCWTGTSYYLSKFIWWSLIIIITLNIQTIDLIFIVMSTTFRSICPSAFFRCFMSNSGVYTESRTEPMNWTTGVNCSNSVNHGRALVLSHSKYSFVIPTCCWDWTCNLGSTFQPNVLSSAPCILAGYHSKRVWTPITVLHSLLD